MLNVDTLSPAQRVIYDRMQAATAERKRLHDIDTAERLAQGLPERNTCFYYSDDGFKSVQVILRSAAGRWCSVMDLVDNDMDYDAESVITDYDKAVEYFNLHKFPNDFLEV